MYICIILGIHTVCTLQTYIRIHIYIYICICRGCRTHGAVVTVSVGFSRRLYNTVAAATPLVEFVPHLFGDLRRSLTDVPVIWILGVSTPVLLFAIWAFEV